VRTPSTANQTVHKKAGKACALSLCSTRHITSGMAISPTIAAVQHITCDARVVKHDNYTDLSIGALGALRPTKTHDSSYMSHTM
jgi:hypothetical protein